MTKISAYSNRTYGKLAKRAVFSVSIIFFMLIFQINLATAAFKDTGWGVRSAGMGNAFVAVANDATASQSNPAGLGKLTRPEVNFMYSRLYTGLEKVDIGLSYMAYVLPIESLGSFGLSWSNFNTTGLYREDTVMLSYGRMLKNEYDITDARTFYIGTNVKYLSHGYKLDAYSQRDPVFAKGTTKGAVTFDLGTIVSPRIRGMEELSFGASIKNITEPDVGLLTEDKVPLEVRAGIAYYIYGLRFVERISVRDITLAFDMQFRNQEWGATWDMWNIHGGVEGWFAQRSLGLRAGGNVNEFTTGFSFVKQISPEFGIQFDYAFIWPFAIRNTYGSHRIAFGARF